MEDPQPVPVWIALLQWGGSLVVTIGLGVMGLWGKTMRAFREDLKEHIEEDERQFTRLSGQVQDIDRKVTQVAAIQGESVKQADRTQAIVEKIRDHLLRDRVMNGRGD